MIAAEHSFADRQALAAAELDMQWHFLSPTAPLQNPDDFEKQALDKTHLNVSYVPPRYRSTYFSHIWGGGYSANYYAYMWSEVLDADAFAAFVGRERGVQVRRPHPDLSHGVDLVLHQRNQR